MNRAFTVIELLVTVAIIAILAGIFFGVAAPAKQSAKRSVCVANLQQIGVASGLYTSDHDGRFPASVNEIESIDPAIQLGRAPDQKPTAFPTPREALTPYTKADSIFACPDDDGVEIGLINSGGKKQIEKPGPLHWFNDGASYLFADLLNGQNPATWHHPDREGWATDANNYWHDPAAHTPLGEKGKANVLFYDLHVGEKEYATVQWQESVWPD